MVIFIYFQRFFFYRRSTLPTRPRRVQIFNISINNYYAHLLSLLLPFTLYVFHLGLSSTLKNRERFYELFKTILFILKDFWRRPEYYPLYNGNITFGFELFLIVIGLKLSIFRLFSIILLFMKNVH